MYKVIQQLVDDNGRIIGIFDNNPALNTLVYDVEFPESDVKQYASNVIAITISSQVDYDDHILKTLYGIVDYKRDDSAVSKSNAFIITTRGVRKLRQLTIG